MICLLCVCSRVFIRSLISRHNGLWLCAAALSVNSELSELFIFEGVLIKLHSQLKIRKAIREVGRKEVLMNFSKAGAETANSNLEIFLCWRLDDAGRSAVAEGFGRLPEHA